MFTFTKQTTPPIFFINDQPVYTTFQKDEKIRIRPFRDSSKYLDSDNFRERYTLSKRESTELKKAIQSNIAPDNALKGKFYHIRRDLNERLFTEIDLRGTDKEISWKYPVDIHAWSESSISIGSSGVGKTRREIDAIVEALKRSRKRKFVYVSPEFHLDNTLKKLRNSKRWSKWFEGVDISDEGYKDSERATPDEWWALDIEPILTQQKPGTHIVLDDLRDSVLHKHLQRFLVKYLRTGRHRGIGVTSIQHSIRGGKYTSQSFSSVKWVTLYPRGGGKGKQVEFLYETVGIGRRKARQLVDIFGEGGRWMTIHQWSPTIIFGKQYALFV
jgi:hypothetical protein